MDLKKIERLLNQLRVPERCDDCLEGDEPCGRCLMEREAADVIDDLLDSVWKLRHARNRGDD